MNFSDNLRQLRKEKGFTQEDLAEIMYVIRQAVSKWEQGQGYAETEKLLLLADKFNISLDCLMSCEIAKESDRSNDNITGTIVIKSAYENVVVTCNKVISSQKFKGGKNSPQFALFGVNGGVTSLG